MNLQCSEDGYVFAFESWKALYSPFFQQRNDLPETITESLCLAHCPERITCRMRCSRALSNASKGYVFKLIGHFSFRISR